MRLLVVDDDPGFRALLRTTFELVDVEVEEAEDAAAAAVAVCTGHPDVVVLDVQMPGMDGLAFCRKLKGDPATRDIAVILLTGAEEGTDSAAKLAGADGFLRKPFSPLDLLGTVERLAGNGLRSLPFRAAQPQAPEEQLLLYARDLRKLLEVERGQRLLLQKAYTETVCALASALESKDTGTSAHSQRVRRYASELARAVDPHVLEAPSVEYGFLLHDVGKIGIPDEILRKEGPLRPAERRVMQNHTILGEQMLGGVAFLRGEGLRIVRSHHERWDGGGYPDGLCRDDIPLSARVFAVADSLDAMTSDRPYRAARPWADARAEIVRESGRQFDPEIVHAFREREFALMEIHRELAHAA